MDDAAGRARGDDADVLVPAGRGAHARTRRPSEDRNHATGVWCVGGVRVGGRWNPPDDHHGGLLRQTVETRPRRRSVAAIVRTASI